MKTVKFKIVDPVGLHARPATLLVQVASQYSSKIIIHFNGRELDMKSILSLMSGGIKADSIIQVCIEGNDEDPALQEVMTTVEANNFAEVIN